MPRTLFSFPSLCTKLKRLTLVSLPSVCSKDTQSYLALISVWMYSPRACSRFLSVCTKLTLYSVLVSSVCIELKRHILLSLLYVCTEVTFVLFFCVYVLNSQVLPCSRFRMYVLRTHVLTCSHFCLYVLNTCVIACSDFCLYALTSFIPCPHYHPVCMC